MRVRDFFLGETGPLDETLQRFGIPERLHFGLIHYIADGLVPGHFLRAVLRNDLQEAIFRGDEESLVALPCLVRWLYSEAPAPCWGSPSKVDAWIVERQRDRAKES
jgi:hypothetical protein